MENRTNKQVTDIIDHIKDVWQLSLNEEDLLDSVLILFSAQKTEKLKQIEYLLTITGFKFCWSRHRMSDLQPRGNQVRILDSRAAVYVQLGLISIAYYHVRRRDYSVTA